MFAIECPDRDAVGLILILERGGDGSLADAAFIGADNNEMRSHN
jgi:hypothetical protein